MGIRRRLFAPFLILVGRHPSRGRTAFNVPAKFPAFAPNSAGAYSQRADLTVDAINDFFASLGKVIAATSLDEIQVLEVAGFVELVAPGGVEGEELRELMDKYGSDKGSHHGYHEIYAAILSDRESIEGVLEVGLGTNHEDVVSNMGLAGKPGASLRAFRDFLPNSIIFGADIDRRVLFSEERIKTFWVDQTSDDSLDLLATMVPQGLDLVIDDGLHSPHANLKTLALGLRVIRKGGWIVVEDISPFALEIWISISAFLRRSGFACWLVRSPLALVFIMRSEA